MPGRVPRLFLRGAGGGICAVGGVGGGAVATGSAWSSGCGRFLVAAERTVGMIRRFGPLALATGRKNLTSSDSMLENERESGPPSGADSMGGNGGISGSASRGATLAVKDGQSRASGS